MMHESVSPPSAVPQWTAADLEEAKRQGRPDLISRALDSGQLADVIASGEARQPDRPLFREGVVDAKDILDHKDSR